MLTIGSLLPAGAEADGTRVAVEDHDSRWTYQQLLDFTLRYAAWLSDHGVGAGSRVAVCVPRDRHAIAVVAGLSWLGAVYMPFDVAHPPQRVEAAAQAAVASHLIVAPDGAPLSTAGGGPVRLPLATGSTDRLRHALPAPAVAAPFDPAPDDPAYIVHTSGTTGYPKGIVIPAAGLQNFVRELGSTFALTAEDTVLQVNSLGFDASLFEICLALGAHAKIRIARLDLGDLHRATRSATAALLTPSLLRTLPGSYIRSIGTMICGGEQMLRTDLDRLRSADRVFNAYGPSECSICATVYRVPKDLDRATVPIGRPLGGFRCALDPVDASDELAGGVLEISGVGVALGYTNPELAVNEAFRRDRTSGTRTFRTGDIVRYSDDGDLVYLRREDRQIKLHGQRIELDEVEAVIGTSGHVRLAAVDVVEGRRGHSHLRATVQLAAAGSLDQLKSVVARRLPELWRPTEWVVSDDIRLTPNGKVAR